MQHFVTHAPWEADALWERSRAVVPLHEGLLAIDDTGLPKQGRHSPSVQRQHPGALGKIGNGQVAVSTVWLADGLTWTLVCDLYVPQPWIADPDRRARAGIPETTRVREKWRIALSHIRRAVKAGVTITAVPDTAWTRVTWATGTKGPLAARLAAYRVRPVRSCGERWQLCERSLAIDERKYCLLDLDATATLHDLVRLTRSRWPSEQQYRELKDEVGFDHFEGRTYRGWTLHVVLTAIAFTFLQLERQRNGNGARPTMLTVRVRMREIMGVL